MTTYFEDWKHFVYTQGYTISMQMKKRLECKIFGRVQMVMFRDFTQRNARKLGVVGTVQNLPDKTVSVVAEGEENMLQELLMKLNIGPSFAHVIRIEEMWSEPQNTFTNFNIVYKDIWDRI